MLTLLFWLLLIMGAFLFNILGMMQLVPRLITFPLLFFVLFLAIYTLFQRNSYNRYR